MSLHTALTLQSLHIPIPENHPCSHGQDSETASAHSPSPTERKTESSKWLWLLKLGSLAGLKLPSSGQQHGEQSAAKLPKLDYQHSQVSVPIWLADCRMLRMGRWAASPRADLQAASEEEE